MDQAFNPSSIVFKFPKHKGKLSQKPNLKLESTASCKSILTANSGTLKNYNILSPLPMSCKSGKNLIYGHPKKTSNKTLFESFVANQKFPISSSHLITNIPNIPEWFKTELEAFPTIYYLCKKEKPLLNPTEIEQDGEMKTSTGDDLAYRYEIIKPLGKGSFGEVVEAFDHLDKTRVALKIIRNKPRYEEQAQVEIETLKFIQSRCGEVKTIVQFFRSFMFRKHTVLVFELLSENLYEYLKANNFRGLKIQIIKKICYQSLKALSYLESQNLIHCDIKPENILIQSSTSTSIKLIDFGSSCFEARQLFTYIQSRFYRAPEIVLGIKYTTSIDIWSLGCVLVELYTGLPIFPAENEKELMSCITEVIGEPPSELVSLGTRSHMYFYANGQIKPYQNSRGRRRYPNSRPLSSILKGADNEFITLVASCLQWSPDHRTRASIALKHPYLQEKPTSPTVYGRYCKLSMEDLIRHTPHLQKLMSHKTKPSATN